MPKKTATEKKDGKVKTTIYAGDRTNKIKNPPKPEPTETEKK